jgi:hypothetical protein
MTPEDDPSARRFEDLLPWFVNGRLAEADRQWMQAHLRDRPDAAARLQQYRTVHQAVQHAVHSAAHAPLGNDAAALPFDLGWREYAARHGLADDDAAIPASAATPRGPSHRPRRWWAGVAWMVVLVQGAAIAVLLQREAAAPWATERSSAGALATDTVELMVTFRQDASEGPIRQLMLELNARFVDGPTQAGEYRLRVPAGDAAAAITALRGSPLVHSVERP